ncbi:MAG: sugar ABC transporter permease [Oscillospiraceae bacterium]|nr:sugar ABC transporter permease [Oscillospiraceae bacterium]
MGLANIFAGQYIKGLLFLAIEVAFIAFLLIEEGGIFWLSMLPSLGDKPMQEIWNDKKGIYEYVMGDNSQLILLYGIATICVSIVMVLIWRASVRSGYKGLSIKKAGKKVPTFVDDIKSMFDEKVHQTLMSAPAICLFVFTIIPLIYMMCMAFTNYSKEGDHLILFDWVGFDNFIALFNPNSTVGKQFWEVLIWTLVWAIFATFLNFIFGTIVAIIINRPTTRLKGLWRGLLSLTIAVPQFVSLMVIYNMIQPDGIINRMMWNMGILAEGTRFPFLTDPMWARATVIIVNLWVGIPYTIMQVTGILKNIPADLYEAARIDGANSFQQFMNITLPYMLFVTTPYLITQFTGNVNNFNVIYLTTRGYPIGVGETAGATDLLVTWLYKLSVDKQEYNMAAVIGIFTFIVLSIVSLVAYRSTGSYKDEEGFK